MTESDGATVRVKGLSKTLGALRKLGASQADVKAVTRPVAEMVASDAKTLVPTDTGKLEGTIKGVGARTRVRVKAGGRGVKYAGVIEYGNPNRPSRAFRFLREARERNLDKAMDMLRTNIKTLADRYGFDTDF